MISRSARMKLDDEVLELKQWDAIGVPAEVTRGFEAGDDGAEIIAFGAPNTDGADVEMVPGWWTN